MALNAIADKRGRRYTLVAHVMDSVETSIALGQDVQAWLRQGMVDILLVGIGFMPYSILLDECKALGHRHEVPIYPSLNTRPLSRLYKQRLKRVSAWYEYIRAAAAWWWHKGVDGIYIFNLFTQEEKDVGPMDKKFIYAPLKDIGDPAVLAGKDKLYGIEPLTFAGMFSQGSEAPALPMPSIFMSAAYLSKWGRMPMIPVPDSRFMPGRPDHVARARTQSFGCASTTRCSIRCARTATIPARYHQTSCGPDTTSYRSGPIPNSARRATPSSQTKCCLGCTTDLDCFQSVAFSSVSRMIKSSGTASPTVHALARCLFPQELDDVQFNRADH